MGAGCCDYGIRVVNCDCLASFFNKGRISYLTVKCIKGIDVYLFSAILKVC